MIARVQQGIERVCTFAQKGRSCFVILVVSGSSFMAFTVLSKGKRKEWLSRVISFAGKSVGSGLLGVFPTSCGSIGRIKISSHWGMVLPNDVVG